VFARRSGLDAEDAVQGFCETLIHQDSLRTADRAIPFDTYACWERHRTQPESHNQAGLEAYWKNSSAPP
jgi:hypothetical protein